jgi:hypothetical protein
VKAGPRKDAAGTLEPTFKVSFSASIRGFVSRGFLRVPKYYPNYMQKNSSMKGWWVGYTQDNSSTANARVTRGESEWEKLD